MVLNSVKFNLFHPSTSCWSCTSLLALKLKTRMRAMCFGVCTGCLVTVGCLMTTFRFMCSEWLLFFLFIFDVDNIKMHPVVHFPKCSTTLFLGWFLGFRAKRARKTRCHCLSHTCWPPVFYGLTHNKLQHFKLLNHSLQSLQKKNYFLQCPLVYNFPVCFAFFFILLLLFPVHLFIPVLKGHILW